MATNDDLVSVFFCDKCDFRSFDNETLVKHVLDRHSRDPNFSVACNFCGKTYTKWNSFKKHLHRTHGMDSTQGSMHEWTSFMLMFAYYTV